MRSHHLNWPQTVGALYAQARDAGWSAAELSALLAAHAAIEPLFAGWRRASGRCFTSHLAGTASLTVEFGGDVDDVLAALAHAVFDEGAYGRADGAFRGKAAALLMQAFPPKAGEIVAGYSAFRWPAFVSAAEKDLRAAVAGADPRLVRLRIANEIDDALDWPFFTDVSRAAGMRELGVSERVARALGWEALAGRAAFVAAAMEAAPAAPGRPRDAAYFVKPIGYLRPFTERLRGRLGKILRRR